MSKTSKTTKSTTKRDVEVVEVIDLDALQKELDDKKYIQSEIAKQDLSGEMPYCKNCAFQRANAEKTRNICNLDRKPIVENQVCAKNKVRNGK